jgi:hypothetical protein
MRPKAWLAAIADKVEVGLEGIKVAKPGVGFGGKATSNA